VVHKKKLHQARASLSSWLMIRRQKKTSVKKKERESSINAGWLVQGIAAG
jgi:hypothetical protein